MISSFVYPYKGEVTSYQAHVTLFPRGISLVFLGGDAHIGTLILAEARPSLKTPQAWSASSSVINRLGHLDEIPLRRNAERLAGRFRIPVAITGGIHVDGLSRQGIEDIQIEVDTVFKELEDKIIQIRQSEL